jgi:fluoroquinolone resistance protein
VTDAILSSSEYVGQEIQGLVHQNADIRDIEFDECTFVDCSFRETIFSNCSFRDCIFRGSDLSLAQVKNCKFTSTRFEDSQLIGINWAEANWHKQGFLKTVDFSNCVLNYSSFFGLSLNEVKLVNCMAKEVDFAEADLSHAQCMKTDFLNSRFHNTNLAQADFTGAINYAIAASANVLKATKFSLPEAMSLLYSLDIILTE